jgi:plastocyanin
MFKYMVCSMLLATGAMAMGDITGTIKLDGKAPQAATIDMAAVKECADQHPDPVYDESLEVGDKGGIQNVVVSITPAEGQKLPGDVPKDPAVLDQQGCMYIPHIVAMMAGQTLLIKNSDPFLHNSHSLSQDNPPFNKPQPTKDEAGIAITDLKTPEYFKIKCDVHPWMEAYIAVMATPYFAVSDDSGNYTIKGLDKLPDGEYTLTAWQETLGQQDKKIKIVGGKATADFSFKPDSARANPVKEIRLADLIKTNCCAPDVTK